MKSVLLAAIGGGIVSVATGCSSHPCIAARLASLGGYCADEQVADALGCRNRDSGAVVSSSSQGADASGGDENAPVQTNPVTTVVPISAK